MLPPGHIAAGYLVARALLAATHPSLSLSDQQYLIWWGVFFGFAPDLDTFIVFKKMKRFISSDEIDHRAFYSHAPTLWLIGGLVILFVGAFIHSVFLEYLGILLWLCSWTHFALDTIQNGIMWLWPWRKRLIALSDPGMKSDVAPQKFISYWLDFLKFYITKMTLPFCLEILLIIVALFVYY